MDKLQARLCPDTECSWCLEVDAVGSLLILLSRVSTLRLLDKPLSNFPISSFFLNTFFLLCSICGHRHKVNKGPLQFPSYLPDPTSSLLESHIHSCSFLSLGSSTPTGPVDFFSSHTCLEILPSQALGRHLSALGSRIGGWCSPWTNSASGAEEMPPIFNSQSWYFQCWFALKAVSSGDGSRDGS